MENLIIIISAADIPPAIQIARNLPSYTIYTFDPILVDQISSSGLENINFIPFDNCPLYHELDASAHSAAFDLESALDLEVREIIPEVSIAGWQHLNLYYILIALKWYTALWENLGNKLSGTKVHLFICDTPGSYYFNSYIPSILLLWYLKCSDIDFSGFTYGSKDEDTHLIPDLSEKNPNEELEQLLIHVPTCWYDIKYFFQEMLSTGKTLVNIEAKHFNIPLPAIRTLALVEVENTLSGLPEEIRKIIHDFSIALTEKLDQIFESYLVIPNYRQRQIRHITNIYCTQLVTYYQLSRYFEKSKPSRIVLSDHDAGFHGPIISFAQKHSLPVIFLPHSKCVNDIEFKYRNITVLSHPIHGQEIFDANRKSVLNFKIAYPETFSGSTVVSGIKTISLLLNSLSLNGVYFTSYQPYMHGIRQIVAWCNDKGIALKIRCKPSYSIISLLERDIGISAAELMKNANETMEQHTNGCDLCLMYDMPTTGALHFLQDSIAILNPIVESLAPSEMTLGNARIVPQESVENTLLRLNRFTSDPSSLFYFRTEQFRNYIALFQNARPLRAYL